MSRVILLAGMLAFLVATGASTLAFKVTEPVVGPPHAAVDPLARHLQRVHGEMALP